MTLKSLMLCSMTLLLFACNSEVKTPVTTQKVVPKEILKTQVGQVQKGQGLFQALRNVAITNTQLQLDIVNALRDEVEFSKLKVGDKLEATFNQNNVLVGFTFSQNLAEKHALKLNNETGVWEYTFIEEPTQWTARILEGELRANSTLQQDLIAQGLPNAVVAEVVNVLLCKVNFRMHARRGDRYRVLLNERMYNDEAIETQILYTAYDGKVAGKSESYFYRDDEKGSTYTAHYTADGQALINSGIRYPLSRLHIRSGYGMRRHPVTGRRAMHRGVDFRGRVGTPVHAVAGGTVVESNFNPFAGNKVRIKHRDGSSSVYMHLHRRSVRKGEWVRSHQVIGTVGATGRVTGPHLHFGFKKPNGQWMNPMKKRMIATPKLAGERFMKLQEQIAQTKNLIQNLELSRTARYLMAQIPNQGELTEEAWKYESMQMIKQFQQVGKTGQLKAATVGRKISGTY